VIIYLEVHSSLERIYIWDKFWVSDVFFSNRGQLVLVTWHLEKVLMVWGERGHHHGDP